MHQGSVGTFAPHVGHSTYFYPTFNLHISYFSWNYFVCVSGSHTIYHQGPLEMFPTTTFVHRSQSGHFIYSSIDLKVRMTAPLFGFLWVPLIYCSTLSCFCLSRLRWNVQLIFLTFSRPFLIWSAFTLHSSSPPFILPSLMRSYMHAPDHCAVQVERACPKPGLDKFLKETNEVCSSETLLASNVQPIQT